VATKLYGGIEPQPLKGIAHCNINPDLPKKQKKTLIFLVHHEKKVIISEVPKRGWLKIHFIPKDMNHKNKRATHLFLC